jgi:OmcA/MtrC family decaheme c-type cytochrome
MHCNFESEGKKMKSILIRLGLLALMISALASCGGNDGSTGSAGAPGTPGTGGSVVNATNLTSAQWLALKPSIDPASISVTINSPPVVKFRVTDQYGNPLVGLGGQRQLSTALVPTNYNMFFTLAKLVPVSGGPSKWVNYLVTKPAVSGTANASVADGMTWVGTYPTPDQEGTLVDNGDGSYQYTFLRDVKHAAVIVAGLTDAGSNVKADLGDLTYDPTLTHRLGIVIQGSQPGTGVNTPNNVQVTTAVPMVNTFNIGYDFVPNGGAVTTTRDIVEKASCTECHQGRGIGHVTSNSGITTNPANGVPAGAFIGRNDPRLCVTCHTDQTKYGFANVVETTGLSPALTTSYYRTTTGEAAFTYPRMIHQTHMGAMNPVVSGSGLVKTGYNLNGHCNSPGQLGYNAAKPPSNQAQCYNQLQYPQDVRNCTKCHDGSASAVNKTTDGDNWMNVPSRLACGSCHDGINFVTGAGITLLDRDVDVKAKAAIGTHASGHQGGAQADDHLCITCHTAANTALYHGPFDSNYPATAFTGIPASAAASLRTMSAAITAAAVSATDGSVTVSFKLADSAGAAVDMPTAGPVVITAGTNPAGLPFKSLNFTLAKLTPAANGVSTSWKSYTGKCNVNNAGPNPDMVGSSAYHNILQGYSEVAIGQATAAQNLATNSAGKPYMQPGILTSLGSGNWTYKFALVNAATHNADTSGDIRTITTAINLNTATPLLSVGGAANPAAAYNWNAVPTCPDDGVTGIAAGTTSAAYDPTLTHRIGMILNKNDTLGADAVTNATYDFTPDGNKVAQTRNIVTMANCATCHAGRKIHKGYATELCVTCHNQNTSDPSDSDATITVDLQRIVHKLHYKGTDFWVHGEAFGTGSMTGFPGNVMKCQVCHNENATKPTASTSDGNSSSAAGKALENASNWYTTPTSRACGTCHDDTVATAHIASQISGSGVEMCVTCHGAGSADGLDAKAVHSKLLP